MAETGSYTCTHFANNENKDKPRLPQDIDKIISAELPDPSANPKLFDIVVQAMIHGPCGVLNPRCVSMEASGGQSTCSNIIPKRFSKEMFFRKDEILEYKRRGLDDGGYSDVKAVKNNIVTLDNSGVVPFNPYLTMKFQAHINCEIVNTVAAVKYLYKYIMKSSDRILVNMRRTDTLE